jgi:hypothetical protein
MVFDSIIRLNMSIQLQSPQIFDRSALDITKFGHMLFGEFDDDLDLVELLEVTHLAAQFVDDPLDELDLGAERLLLLLYV